MSCGEATTVTCFGRDRSIFTEELAVRDRFVFRVDWPDIDFQEWMTYCWFRLWWRRWLPA